MLLITMHTWIDIHIYILLLEITLLILKKRRKICQPMATLHCTFLSNSSRSDFQVLERKAGCVYFSCIEKRARFDPIGGLWPLALRWWAPGFCALGGTVVWGCYGSPWRDGDDKGDSMFWITTQRLVGWRGSRKAGDTSPCTPLGCTITSGAVRLLNTPMSSNNHRGHVPIFYTTIFSAFCLSPLLLML